MTDDTTPAGIATTDPSPLTGYPPVAGCPECRRYVSRLGRLTPYAVVAAALGHHASAHTCDPLTLASQHFA